MSTKVDLQQISAFLNLVRSVENNDFAGRAAESCRFIHSTLGLVTEVAELKLHMAHVMDQNSNKFLLKLQDEIGDICFYLLQGMDNFNWAYEQVVYPRAIWDKGVPRIVVNIDEPIDGICILLGEVADVLKKYLAYGTEIDDNKLIRWYAQIWKYLQEIVKDYSTTIEDCIKVTTAKLNHRYSKGHFRYEDRTNRDRKAEKKVMEKTNDEEKS